MSDKFIIRSLEMSDLEEALKLWNISFNTGFSSGFDTIETLTRYLRRNPGFSSVAYTQDGKLVGALLCGHDGRRGSIYHTAVYKEYQNHGIGRRLELRSTNELKKIGITTGFLFINIKNPGSEAFWTSIGWTVIDDIKYLYKQF